MVNCKFTHKDEFFDQSHALTLSFFICIETNSSMVGPLLNENLHHKHCNKNFKIKCKFYGKYPMEFTPCMSIFGTCTQNIPNQTSLREKKIDNNLSLFLSQKLPFMAPMTNTNSIFK